MPLPVEGLYSDTDTALPVAQDDSYSPTGLKRVYIFKNDNRPIDNTKPESDDGEGLLSKVVKNSTGEHGSLWDNFGMAGVEDKSGQSVHPLLKQLFGLGGEQRYQLWPERLVRSGIAAAHDVMSGETPQWAIDPVTGDVHTSPQMIERSMDMASLAGTGGLAGGTTDASLGSAPFLRPALKYEGKIYKAPVGGQHLDALPPELADTFQKQAMSGEDISNFNFGFMNHKGQFLTREKALDYAINEGLVDPHAGQYGTLTSTLLADSSQPGMAIEAMKAAKPFYSAVEQQVNAIPQAKMTGDQWLGTLANKPGVKPEELQWTGLADFLAENKGKAVSKEAIQEHLAANKVELKEVTKQNDPKGDIEGNGWVSTEGFKSNEVRYKAYQLPGGENYREMLLTLPDQKFQVYYNKNWNPRGDTKFEDLPSYLKKDIRNAYTEETGGTPTNSYKSSHWDEPNILAHVRMNDRTIEGKKSLHLEEVQSDWHQQGRDRGYKSDVLEKKELTPEEAAKSEHLGSAFANHALKWREENGVPKDAPILAYRRKGNNEWNYSWAPEEYKNDALLKSMTDKNSGVPDAPFKKSWHELALKRAMFEAASKGYDRLSWTPGEAQAARYDLSKSIDNIKINPASDAEGAKHVTLNAKHGVHGSATVDGSGKILRGYDAFNGGEGKNLSDFVGKDLAKNILKTEGETKIAGDGLKVGGEGMKGFYDQIIPKAIERLGKEHGVKVKKQTINHIDDEKMYNDLIREGYDPGNAEDMVARLKTQKGKSTEVHYIDIPQSLKDQAMHKGFPLFSAGVPIPNESKNASK